MAKSELKIPTTYLPEDWRRIGAQKFSCSESKIERVVYGTLADMEITEFMIGLAEEGKAAAELRLKELKNRVKAIN